ncbi:uncharacterized protein LOC122558644 [Chiloscyllium plagiosum]|uniref:uncharacterized protein LOC122558644 n=1 Tax=Chiloscyllium plagiosum TaxID=36176 RepID=UPI001CB7BC76|nr:uncharacterized protein LOC122558644 [Chiloscyllium plagiosum]
MYCSIPLFDRKLSVDVSWRKDGQTKTLDPTADERKIMLPFKQASAEFHLLNVSFRDSGIYYCSISVFGRKTFNGNGTKLIVHVPPTPLKITRLDSPFLALLCTTAGFFPGQFELVWYKNFSEITSGISIRKILNEEGLFQVSSELSLPERGSVYTCQVSHVALGVPANISYTVPNHAGRFHTINIFRLILGIVVMVLGTAFIVDHLKVLVLVTLQPHLYNDNQITAVYTINVFTMVTI